MARNKTVFICESCGASHAKWAGQCSDCGAWNTLVESVAAAPAKPGAGRILLFDVRCSSTPMRRTERASAAVKNMNRRFLRERVAWFP